MDVKRSTDGQAKQPRLETETQADTSAQAGGVPMGFVSGKTGGIDKKAIVQTDFTGSDNGGGSGA